MAAIGLLVNIVMAIIKFVAGWLGHSQALIADAVESMTDIGGSLIVLGGLRIAERPPDQTHPYGHGKAEPIAALVVSMMLIAAGIGVAWSAIHEIINPQQSPAAFTLWVLIGVVVIKESLFQFGRRISTKSGSGAVLADAWHHRSDALTSLAAAIGISVALIGGPEYAIADGLAALFASGIILFNAVRIAMTPMQELMDAVPVELIEQVRSIAAAVPGVKEIEKLQARKSGTRYWVDMHVQVDPLMSVRDGHAVAHAVKDAVRNAFPQVHDVLIHVEPHEI
jgi:cation diffusion facilitator family transporter